MSVWRIMALVVCFAFFGIVALANSIMALSLGTTHYLMILWLLVPVPLIFLVLRFRAPRMKAIRVLGYSYLGVSIFVTTILWGVGWYFSDVLKDGALVPDYTPPEYDLQVGDIQEGYVTLYPTSDAEADGPWTRDGTWGLEWSRGYDQVGKIVEITEDRVVREYMPISGGLNEGELVRLDSWAFAGDPLQAFGIPFQEVSYSSPVGDFPAWLVNGTDPTWVIFVHGKGAERGQALRMVPTMAEMGYPFMVITYRNDEGVPSDKDGFYRYGQTEYEDLEYAVTYALDHGADQVVLAGYSMGGAIIAKFLCDSPIADNVSGVILDAPMMNFSATVDLGASQKGYPVFISAIGQAVSSYRFGIHWEALNYLKRTDRLSSPILLFHGDADIKVPITTSDALAEARSDIVTYVIVEGARHNCAWNTAPDSYEAAVRDFLMQVAP
ncbi:MAG: alpha/beta hydrolase [Dehalococcoidales bacterium]|nr:MAG: alpha/beta hydrolase [Dehalococcoidales bacterium]